MNQRTFLGLTHNPFVAPNEGFFAGADRKTHLEHLRHLSQWSRRVLVVTGPFGIGKSTLFKELSGNLEPQTKATRIAGTVVTGERDILTGMLQGFGVAADSELAADDIASVLCGFVDDQEANGRHCMVMLDDAHLIDPSAIQRLVDMVASSSLRVVAFAETNVVGVIDKAAKTKDLEWFEIRLTGFPKADVRDYLEWRFSQAQYRGLLPFTDEQLEYIVAKSSGNPGLIDSMASNMLVELETGGGRKQSKFFPWRHAILALLLVTAVGLIYLLLQYDESTLNDAVVSQDSVVGEQGDTSSNQTDSTTGGHNQAAEQQNKQPNEWVLREFGVIPEDPNLYKNQDDNSQQENSPQENTIVEQTADTNTPSDAGGDTANVMSDEEVGGALAQSAEELSVVETETVDPSAEQAESSVSTAAESTAETESAYTNSDTNSITNNVITVVESTPALANGRRDGEWILAQNPQAFIIQLVSVSKAERALELVASQSNPKEFTVYSINRDGKQLHVINYGLYETADAANAAALNLQGDLRTVKGWVRSMRAVQQAVRAGQ